MKKYLILILCLISVCSVCSAQTARSDTATVSESEIADMLIEEGMKKIGTPYGYGSSGPKSFDCSGFVRYVFSKFGYDLKRSSREQATQGTRVEGPFTNLRKGDLVFFSGRKGGKTVGHAGIFIKTTDDGKDFVFIHSAVKGGVQVNRYSEPYYSSRYICATRIIDHRKSAKSMPVRYFDGAEALPELEPVNTHHLTSDIILDHEHQLIYSAGSADLDDADVQDDERRGRTLRERIQQRLGKLKSIF